MVYKLAKMRSYAEVNVEDPARGFQLVCAAMISNSAAGSNLGNLFAVVGTRSCGLRELHQTGTSKQHFFANYKQLSNILD